VTGSKQGLFLRGRGLLGTLLILEGLTDAAAAIELGFGVIGRPACLGCEDMIVALLKGAPGHPFVIADADGPGSAAPSNGAIAPPVLAHPSALCKRVSPLRT